MTNCDRVTLYHTFEGDNALVLFLNVLRLRVCFMQSLQEFLKCQPVILISE